MQLYSGLAVPSGRYASLLEKAWAIQFINWDWHAEYIGDHCNFADFDVGGVLIEVKPEGEEYVQQAASRSGNILVVEGSPGFGRWWFVDYVHTPLLMGTHPRHIPWPARFGEPVRMEMPQEFMDRVGYRFE